MSNSHLTPIVITALHTGMRRGEILGLQWEKNVDLKHGFILLDKTKNGERREIPISDTLRSVLQGILRRIDVPYVFFDAATGKPYKDVKRSFGTALRKAEWESCQQCHYERQKIQAADPGNCPHCGSEIRRHKGIEDFHFHDLRHTFASQLVMAGEPLAAVSKLLGHKHVNMTMRYSHLAPAHLRKAVSAMDKITTHSESTAYFTAYQAKKEAVINA